MTVEVLEPGLLTTVQDAGRPAWTRLGVPVGGACDPWSLAVANLLAGADAGAAALEMTVFGAVFAVREPTTIGLAGADLGGVVRESGRRLRPGRSHAVPAGSTIAFPGATGGSIRSYLALPGGLDVPAALGSASTLVSAGLGGIEGRAVQAGDIILARGGGAGQPPEHAWPPLDGDPSATLAIPGPVTLRIVAGPAGGADALVDGEWQVRPDSDRVGLRLERAAGIGTGADAVRPLPGAGELLSHGVVSGAIQLPPSGGPLVLLADHQTTGGYPVAAVVARADHPLLGQLGPGASIRFAAVTADEARAAAIAQADLLARGAAALRGDDPWDELWRSAGR